MTIIVKYLSYVRLLFCHEQLPGIVMLQVGKKCSSNFHHSQSPYFESLQGRSILWIETGTRS
jgi:hypothetical protein